MLNLVTCPAEPPTDRAIPCLSEKRRSRPSAAPTPNLASPIFLASISAGTARWADSMKSTGPERHTTLKWATWRWVTQIRDLAMRAHGSGPRCITGRLPAQIGTGRRAMTERSRRCWAARGTMRQAHTSAQYARNSRRRRTSMLKRLASKRCCYACGLLRTDLAKLTGEAQGRARKAGLEKMV